MARKRIEFRHLQAFVEVCSVRHFTRAAQSLAISQPALSSLILQLEQDLGVQLLIRTTRSVEITPPGREFLVSASRIVADLQRSVQELQDYSMLRRGRLRIAALPSLCTYLLPRAARQFSETYPSVSISIVDVMGDEVIEQVLRRSVDLGIGYVVASDTVIAEPILSDRLMAVGATGAFPSLAPLPWHDLAAHQLIAMSEGTTIRRLFDAACASAGFTPNIVLEASQMPTALAYARNNLGVAILPSSGVPDDDPDLTYVDLIDPSVERSLSVIRARDTPIGSAGEAFLKILKSLSPTGAF